MILGIRSSATGYRTGTVVAWTSTAAFLPYRRTLGTSRSPTHIGMKQPPLSCYRSQPSDSSPTGEVRHEPASRSIISCTAAEVFYTTPAAAATRKPPHRNGVPRQLPLAVSLCISTSTQAPLQSHARRSERVVYSRV